MLHKDIKLIIRKQLKKQLPNWKRLSRKEKKEIAEKVLSNLVAEYDFKQIVTAPKEDLLGVEQQMPTKGVIKFETPFPLFSRLIFWCAFCVISLNPGFLATIDCMESIRRNWRMTADSPWPF